VPLGQGPTPQPRKQSTTSLSGSSVPLGQGSMPQPRRRSTTSLSGSSVPLDQEPTPQPRKQSTTSLSGSSVPLGQGSMPQLSKQSTTSLSGSSVPLDQEPTPQPSKQSTTSLSGSSVPLGQGSMPQPSKQSTTSLSGSSVPLGQGSMPQLSKQPTASLSRPSMPLGQGPMPLPSRQSTTSLSGLSGKSPLTLGLQRQNKQTVRLSSPFFMQPPSPSVDISPVDINSREQGPVVGSRLSMHSAQQSNLSPMIASAKGNTSTIPSHLDLNVPQVVRWSRPKPSSIGRGLSIFIVVMLVVIIGSTMLFLFLTRNQTSTPPVTTPGKTITTAQNAMATSTSVAIPNPYGDRKGLLVLNSALNQQDSKLLWDEQNGVCEFADNSYHVIAGAQTQRFTVCRATASNYANFVYEVQMTFVQVSATESSGGLVFRASEANQLFYFLEIFSSGYFAFYRCPGTYGAACPTLSDSSLAGIGALPSFNTTLKQPNTIAIVAHENAFTIYVNNQLAVGPVIDPITSQVISQGTIGMMARLGSSDMMTTDVAFSNVKIWKL
jgi:hypothetical protein